MSGKQKTYVPAARPDVDDIAVRRACRALTECHLSGGGQGIACVQGNLEALGECEAAERRRCQRLLCESSYGRQREAATKPADGRHRRVKGATPQCIAIQFVSREAICFSTADMEAVVSRRTAERLTGSNGEASMMSSSGDATWQLPFGFLAFAVGDHPYAFGHGVRSTLRVIAYGESTQ